MTITHVFAGVPVADFPAAIAWYERLFGRPADVVAHATESLWQGVGDGWIYVIGDAERAGGAIVTFLVDDLDATVAELAQRGLTPDELETKPPKAVFADPDGNRIAFARPL
jgi:catechol 2,3-dioxygenase-like lactoylglutathione lyase family enzyme